MANLSQSCLVLKLALSLKANGSWAGETHIQKGAYFLNDLLAVPVGVNFILYKHGPFSFELRELLTDMEASEFIKWNSQPPYGPSIGEGKLSSLLQAKFSEDADRYKEQIDFVAEHLSKHNVTSLERLATALYVTQEGYSGASRVGRIVDLKPHVSVVLAEKAVEEFDQIKAEAVNAHLITA
jgi:hypothetical protein